jgi:hypothetical protein
LRIPGTILEFIATMPSVVSVMPTIRGDRAQIALLCPVMEGGMTRKQHIHEPEGCLCDVELDQSLVVADADLPAASGGVVSDLSAYTGEDLDGCDLDYAIGGTGDAELPPSAGGVL